MMKSTKVTLQFISFITLLGAPAFGQWNSSGDDIYFNNGKVGIGKAAPAHTLDVNGTIQSKYLHIRNILGGWQLTTNGGGKDLLFRADPNDGSPETRMYLKQNGNVGIGTSTPSSKLHVVAPNYARITMTASTVLRWGSISKTVTGVLAMRLVEEGHIALDDAVINFVPEYDNANVTIRHLLSHQSGTRHYNEGCSFTPYYSGAFDADESLEIVERCSLLFTPGTNLHFEASNIIEVSHTDFYDCAITLDAGNKVVLKPGTFIDGGKPFKITIDGCSNNAPPMRVAFDPTLKESSLPTTHETRVHFSEPSPAPLRIMPNPFRDVVKMTYTVQEAASVDLVLYDMQGKEAGRPVSNERKEPGTYQVEFNGGALPKGIYLYHLQIGAETFRGKLIKTQ